MKRIVFSLFFLLFSHVVLAQGNPGLVLRQIPSPSDWNGYFSGKADIVASNAALKAISNVTITRVFRAGFTAPGDGGAATYVYSSSSCSLNSGAGDNGYQVQPTSGAGCWIADLANAKATPLIWGAIGNGSTDDTTNLRAAVSATGTLGMPLHFDNAHTYLISSAIVATSMIDLEGQTPLGGFGTNNLSTCPGGIVSASNIDGLIIAGPTAIVRNMCFQMGTAEGQRTSGSAIRIGTVSGGWQSGVRIEGTAIYRPYIGISVNDASPYIYGQQTTLRDNTVRDPTAFGMVFGRGTYNDQTANNTLDNNWIACDTITGRSAVGIAIFDGDMDYDGKDAGPEQCFIGFQISPGTVGGNGQNVGGHFKNVLGDSSGGHAISGVPHDLLIQPTSSLGIVGFLSFTHAWAAGGVTTNGDVPVLIDNSAGGLVSNIHFDAFVARSGATSTIMQVNGHVANFTLTGSNLCAWNNGTTTNGLVLNFAGSGNEGHYTITGDHIGDCQDGSGAAMTNGIVITQNGSPVNATITGNDLQGTTNPMVYTPSGEFLTIDSNEGLNDALPSVAAASTISLPNAFPVVELTGTTTITAITNSHWINRKITLLSASAVTFSSGAPYGACVGSVSMAAGGSYSFLWNRPGTCWSHIQ